MANRNIFKNAINNLLFLLHNKLSKPGEIVLEVTDRCNLDCPFCFNRIYVKDRDGSELTTQEAKKIIDSIAHSPIGRTRFSGGEPLIREDIFILIEYAQTKGLRVWLNTNATLLDKEKVAKLSKFVENVLVPLNAFDILSEYNVTNKYLFKNKLKGIRLLKNSNIKVIRCGTVAIKYNIQNLERIHDLINRLKLNDWELYRPIPIRSDLLPVDNNDMALLVEKLLKINNETKKAYKIYNALPFCCYEPEKVAQVANGAGSDDGHRRFVIDSKGRAKPMYYLLENIGDILKDEVTTIWNNNFMREMRELHFVVEVCKKCKYVKVCKGGSKTTSRIVDGDLRSLDYLAQPHKYRDALE